MANKALLDRLGIDVGELVERHAKVKKGVDYTRYADDPVGFTRKILKGELWSMQEEIAEAVRDNPSVVVRSCNAAGKDFVAAQLALWWVYCQKGLVLLTGPTERQVKVIVMGEVARAFHRARGLPGELFQMSLRIPGEEHAGILAFTSSEASRLTGFHAPKLLAIITEAQGVEDFAFEGMLACATGDEDRILAVGNPLNPSGRFYEISKAKHWRSIRISADICPNVVEGKVVIPGGVTKEFGQRLVEEYGQGSGIVTSRWHGDFPEQGEEALFSRAWLNAAVERWEDGMAQIAHDRRTGRLKWPTVAVDPARYGPDSTVLALRRGNVLERLVSWRGLSTMETADRIAEEVSVDGVRPHTECAEAWGKLIVDEVGLGAGVLDRLRQLRYSTEGYNGGFQPGRRDRFFNHRAESFWHLARLLEEGKIALPKDETLFEELLAIQWRPTSSGLVQLEAKADLRHRLGRSIDRADSVCMAFHDYGKPPGFRIGTFRI